MKSLKNGGVINVGEELFDGLEVARKEFNNWQGAAWLYVNLEDMTAWTLVHQNVDYDDVTVIPLVYKDDLQYRDDRYGKDILGAIAQTLLNYVNQNDFKLESKEDFFEFSQSLPEVMHTGLPVLFEW